MTEPKYETAYELGRRTGHTDSVVCTDCGVFVMDTDAHDRFHSILSRFEGTPMTVAAIHMRIVQGHDLIADLPEWDGPIPRAGDYIFHPPRQPGGHEDIAGCVKLVTWRTHDRPGPDATEFVMTAHPYVEIALCP